MSAANELTQWARLMFASLADGGVRDLVVSPGSRSTPFLIAAGAEPRIRCHSAIDERAGGFFALGQARATGRPSAVLCTSGTAAAHYLPAVVEASLAFIPMIVLTADRPLELQDCGAAQTIDQTKLFGDYVRRFYELGHPESGSSALAGLRRLSLQAVHFSGWPVPGPVHMNVRARKPLEPHAAVSDEERSLEQTVDRLVSRAPTQVRLPAMVPDPVAITEVAERLRGARKGLVVVGPAHLSMARAREAIVGLCRALDYPLLAEATSQVRLAEVPRDVAVCDAFDLVLRVESFAKQHAPEVVLQLGSPPTSGAWEQFELRHPDVFKIVVGSAGWQDPTSTAGMLVVADPQIFCDELYKVVGPNGRSPSEWSGEFARASARAWELVDELLVGDDVPLREGHVIRAVLKTIPAGSTLVVGNSLPVRHLDLYGRSGAADVRVICQRGANGIDGLIAGSAGAASVSSGPVTLLTGDVSVIHDLNSLMLAARSPVPFVLVVPHNGGGQIFAQLPLAKVSGLPEGAWANTTTPHRVSFEHAARLFGVRYARAGTTSELSSALGEAYARGGVTLVEATLPDHAAIEDSGTLSARLRAAIG